MGRNKPPRIAAHTLTERQEQTARLFNEGRTVKEIAKIMQIGPKTIAGHIQTIRVKSKNAKGEYALPLRVQKFVPRREIDEWFVNYLTSLLNGGAHRITSRDVVTAIRKEFQGIQQETAYFRYAALLIQKFVRVGILTPKGKTLGRYYTFQWPPRPPR